MKIHTDPRSDDRPDHELADEERGHRGHEDEHQAPEGRPDEPGAEGRARSDKLPGVPDKDDPSPLGDTDQHSTR